MTDGEVTAQLARLQQSYPEPFQKYVNTLHSYSCYSCRQYPDIDPHNRLSIASSSDLEPVREKLRNTHEIPNKRSWWQALKEKIGLA